MKSIKRNIVTAYIMSSDGKLLLGRKNPKRGGVYSDCWHNPGGVDAGESNEQALKREVLEETGMDISGATIIAIDDKGRGESEKTLDSGERVLVKMRFNVYKVSLGKPASEVELAPSDDLENFQWFRLDELQNIKLTPPALALFARIGSEWLG